MTARRRWRATVLALLTAACAGTSGVTRPEESRAAQPFPAAAAGSAGQARGRGRGPSLRESRAITELMTSAERVRGLRFKTRVPVVVEDRERITHYIETQIEDDDLEKSRVTYVALGLLEKDLDVRTLLLRLMGEQIVGYYDPKQKRLVVRDDIMRAFAAGDEEQPDLTEARIVLVHELVHALQDQHLALSEQVDLERDTDAENAFHALVEGDATLAMIGYALEREQIPLQQLTSNPTRVRSFSDVVRASPLAGSELEKAPAIVRVPLLSAYVDGLAFCASLHGAGAFAAVDRAHRTPPASTEQVLHPERFARGDAPVSISLPELRELAQAGYAEVREDTLGELELGVYFSLGSGEAEAKDAADGWGGDRLRVYAKAGGETAVVWLSRWDSERDAEEAERAASRIRSPRPDVLRRGVTLLVTVGLPDPLRARLRHGLTEAGLAGAGARD